MKRSMTQRSYLGWQRYWNEEPWGPWRDNYHAAIIAREIRRGIPGATGLELNRFFFKSPVGAIKTAEQKVFAALGVMAESVSPKEAAKRMRAARKKATRRKKRRDRSS